MKSSAAAIQEYLSQYFTGNALAQGTVSVFLSVLNGDSSYRELKIGIASARNVECQEFNCGQLC